MKKLTEFRSSLRVELLLGISFLIAGLSLKLLRFVTRHSAHDVVNLSTYSVFCALNVSLCLCCLVLSVSLSFLFGSRCFKRLVADSSSDLFFQTTHDAVEVSRSF